MTMSYQEIIVKISFSQKNAFSFLVENCNLTLVVPVIFI